MVTLSKFHGFKIDRINQNSSLNMISTSDNALSIKPANAQLTTIRSSIVWNDSHKMQNVEQ